MADLAHEGMTMVVVTHEMGFAREVADEVIFMDQGAIVERQDVQTFFTAPENLLAKQFLQRIIR
jgi:ABC-type polar amino acid transport system ATPase subunit